MYIEFRKHFPHFQYGHDSLNETPATNTAFWEAEEAVKLLFDGPPWELRIENRQVISPKA